VQRDILLSTEGWAKFHLDSAFLPPKPPPLFFFSPHGTAMASAEHPIDELSIGDLQRHIRHMYFEKDVVRGVDGTFMWLMEEIGELAAALRGNDRENLAEEFADVIAWLATIANVADVDLNAALVAKYGHGCPGCGRLVCECPDSEKP
jgi:NTP pyrophosphatase (non-canonical NTP hydrolase)